MFAKQYLESVTSSWLQTYCLDLLLYFLISETLQILFMISSTSPPFVTAFGLLFCFPFPLSDSPQLPQLEPGNFILNNLVLLLLLPLLLLLVLLLLLILHTSLSHLPLLINLIISLSIGLVNKSFQRSSQFGFVVLSRAF